MSRPATHSGTWYTSNVSKLKRDIANWLSAIGSSPHVDCVGSWSGQYKPGFSRFAVGPHAGYSYCGPVLAHTYASIDPRVTRVFIMGPSHHVYFRGVKTTTYDRYETPIGDLPVDKQTIENLVKNANVRFLTHKEDCDEHALEMHCPLLRATNSSPDVKIVPLLFGALNEQEESLILAVLENYMSDPSTAFVVSSDFCHWGRSFDYTSYLTSDGQLSPEPPRNEPQIWKGIQNLDFLGLEIASTGSAQKWKNYIDTTGNTVCGQRPLETLLKLGEKSGSPLKFKWLSYAQSSKVSSTNQTSVSYAAGAVEAVR